METNSAELNKEQEQPQPQTPESNPEIEAHIEQMIRKLEDAEDKQQALREFAGGDIEVIG